MSQIFRRQRHEGEQARVLQPFRGTPRYVVAAEVEAPGSPRAHAVGVIGPMTDRRGVALCGLPAEELIVVSDLEWQQVENGSRCGLCQAAWPAQL